MGVNVGIIGLGLLGLKRFEIFQNMNEVHSVSFFDPSTKLFQSTHSVADVESIYSDKKIFLTSRQKILPTFSTSALRVESHLFVHYFGRLFLPNFLWFSIIFVFPQFLSKWKRWRGANFCGRFYAHDPLFGVVERGGPDVSFAWHPRNLWTLENEIGVKFRLKMNKAVKRSLDSLKI